MLGWLIHFLSTYRQLVGFGVIVFGPGLLARAQRLIRNRNQPRAPLTSAVWAILIAHALYTLWALVLPPYDVFVSHGLKIRTPSDVLRPIVLRAAGVPFYDFEANPDSYPLLDLLLTRLGNLDGRYQYARWGHDVFMRCAWCKSKGDMALAALPSIVTPYVVEAVVIGLMGWKWVAGQSARERADRFRPVVGWVLGALIAGDFGVRWTWDVRARLDGDCDHVSSEAPARPEADSIARANALHHPHRRFVPCDRGVHLHAHPARRKGCRDRSRAVAGQRVQDSTHHLARSCRNCPVTCHVSAQQ